MARLLVCATQEEAEALFAKTHTPLQASAAPEIRPHVLRVREDIYLCITGVGPVNAALASANAIAELTLQGIAVREVVNLGLAGAFDLQTTPLRSVCAVSEEIWPEYGLHDGHMVVAEAFKWPQLTTEKGPIYDRIPLASQELLDPFAHKTILTSTCAALTVAGVTASFERAETLWHRYFAPLETMEGFAVAYTCLRFGLPVAEIRVVSNKAGPRRADEKDFPGALEKLGEILPTLNLI